MSVQLPSGEMVKVDSAVTSPRVLPYWSAPVAANVCDWPATIELLAGLTVTVASAAGITVRVCDTLVASRGTSLLAVTVYVKEPVVVVVVPESTPDVDRLRPAGSAPEPIVNVISAGTPDAVNVYDGKLAPAATDDDGASAVNVGATA